MVDRGTPQPQPTGRLPGRPTADFLAVERSKDPKQLLANILRAAGALAGQWGEEHLLHLRIAALYYRLGRTEEATAYVTSIAAQHAVDAFNLGPDGTRYRQELFRFFITCMAGGGDATASTLDVMPKKPEKTNPFFKWVHSRVLAPLLHHRAVIINILTPDDERTVREIISPPLTWLDRVYFTPIPVDARRDMVQQLRGINEYGDPDDVERQLYLLFAQARQWHERQADIPTWVHDLDDIGPRAIYMAVMVERPDIISVYLDRCIDALHERPLALMPNVATAIGGLGYMARQLRRDDLVHQALDVLPRLPEHERCISALSLVEVLVERPKSGGR